MFHTLKLSCDIYLFLQTHNLGLVFKWEVSTKSSRLSEIVHSITIPLYLFLFVFNVIFQGVQLFIEMTDENKRVHDYVQNIVWLAAFPSGITTFIRLILKRKELQSFFSDWHSLENQFLAKPTSQIDCSYVKNLQYFVVGINWFVFGSMIIFMVPFVTIYQPDASFVLSHYPKVRETLGLPFIIAFQTTSVFTINICESLSGVVPGFIFYHAGQLLQWLHQDLKFYFKKFNRNGTNSRRSSIFQSRIHAISVRYEVISKLVERANRLFGILMIFNHCILLLRITTILNSAFYLLNINLIQAILYFNGVLIHSYLLMSGHLMAANLSSASDQLRRNVSSLLSRNTVHFTEEDFNCVKGFFLHLQEDQLAARPLNLYSVTSSNVLTFTSLVITYVVILHQA